MELYNAKSESACSALTGIRQTGEVAFFAAQPGWLMTRRARHLQLDNAKSGGGRSAPKGVRRSGEVACFQPHSQSGLHPEALAAGAGQHEK